MVCLLRSSEWKTKRRPSFIEMRGALGLVFVRY